MLQNVFFLLKTCIFLPLLSSSVCCFWCFSVISFNTLHHMSHAAGLQDVGDAGKIELWARREGRGWSCEKVV